MPETAADLAADSRWPAFFPSSICHVSTGSNRASGLERVVGASIVNRFPLILALSVCRVGLSKRHYAREEFMRILEASGGAAVQFLEPGGTYDACARAIAELPDLENRRRVEATGLPSREGLTVGAPVFGDAYLVYEGKLARRPWIDVGSHRMYFLEITAIQLRSDIAMGRNQIRWRSLPGWQAPESMLGAAGEPPPPAEPGRYRKGYTHDYRFPSAGTRAFEATGEVSGMHHLVLPLSGGRVEADNDRARWPCFFPASVGMITCRDEEDRPNVMPCGSTTVLSRLPLTLAIAMAHAPVNERYRLRGSLDAIRRTGRFGCGVPYVSERILAAIRYAGNISIKEDPGKVAHSGLSVEGEDPVPRLAELPVHYDCRVVGQVEMGTHCLLVGQVTRILVHGSVGPGRPLLWNPLAAIGLAGE
jgi:flavin reductase (DIM6/NTAB) family NADH-FMN oxidoreductase RutF